MEEQLLKCPKCESTQLTSNKQGFGAGKALGGALLTGGVGLLAGGIGSNNVLITCLACGKQFKPGEDFEGLKKKKLAQAEMQKNPLYWVFAGVFLLGFLYLMKGCF